MPGSPSDTEALHDGANEEENLLTGAAEQELEESQQGADSAGSPAAENQDDNKPADMAAAVRAALAGGKEQSSGSGEGEGAEKPADPKAAKEAKAPGDDEDKAELSKEEFNALKPKTKRRMEYLHRELTKVSGELDQFKALGADAAAVEADVKGFRSILSLATQANLSKEEVNTGFNIMNLMKNNPEECLKQLTPFYRALQAQVGELLPQDLHDKVTRGELPLPAAKELARLRAKDGLNTNQRQVEQQRTTETRNREIQAADAKLQTDVGKAITDWETRQKSTDPDYSRKQNLILQAVTLEANERRAAGKPIKSVEEAVQMANDIKKKVEAEIRKFVQPKKTAITPVQGKGATNGSKPVPASSRDAIMQALGH